jgi:hypothetical protein
MGSVVLEVMTHIALIHDRGPPKLAVVGADGMERTDRSSLSHRLGVGLTRVVAERQPFYLSHFYYVDGLIHSTHGPPGIAVRWTHGGPRSSADMIAADRQRRWSVLEAKGRSTQTTSKTLAAKAKKQARAVELVDAGRKQVPVAWRIGSVAALSAVPIVVDFADPPGDGSGPIYTLDSGLLLWNYYEPVRDLVHLYGPDLPRLSGEPDFVYGLLPGSNIGLAAHRSLVEACEDPRALDAVSRKLAAEWAERQVEARKLGGFDFDLGLDGLGVVIQDDQLDGLLYA